MGKIVKKKGKSRPGNAATESNLKINQAKHKSPVKKDLSISSTDNFTKWILFLSVIVAVCYIPILNNQFTNWDDEFYVINNTLLKNSDWKGIFTEPVVGNYHPLTMISLLINYKLSGLEPFSYLLLNLLFHLANTYLVFRFINLIAGKKIFVAFFTALLFGIHPMHVESVAWVSERKDVLYAFFFLLSLIQYWHYLNTGKQQKLWTSFLFFTLSLLSKPAAVVLPIVLLLLDYWHGRKYSTRMVIDKIPFFLLSLVIGVITVNIQSQTAVASLETFPIWARMFFACTVIMTYFIRFFIPYPLSAFHPYPPIDNLGWQVYLSPLFIIALATFLWYQRRNKPLVFGVLFCVINLLLVLQIISIGSTLVSERYTYIPYIGLGFALSSILQSKLTFKSRQLVYGLSYGVLLMFGIISFQRTNVWENSGVLWNDVIDKYPEASVPRTNRAHYLSQQALLPEYAAEAPNLYRQAIEDCNIALQSKPNNSVAYEKRGLIFMDLNKNQEALADADSLLKYDPDNALGYDIRGTVLVRLGLYDKGMADFEKCILLDQESHRAFNNRGVLYLHYYKRYSEAIADFTRAIELQPTGKYYVNRSMSYYNLGDLLNAQIDARTAMQLGAQLTNDYKSQININ